MRTFHERRDHIQVRGLPNPSRLPPPAQRPVGHGALQRWPHVPTHSDNLAMQRPRADPTADSDSDTSSLLVVHRGPRAH
eukprot:923752-Pyramimonas_sp.AAC.1